VPSERIPMRPVELCRGLADDDVRVSLEAPAGQERNLQSIEVSGRNPIEAAPELFVIFIFKLIGPGAKKWRAIE